MQSYAVKIVLPDIGSGETTVYFYEEEIPRLIRRMNRKQDSKKYLNGQYALVYYTGEAWYSYRMSVVPISTDTITRLYSVLNYGAGAANPMRLYYKYKLDTTAYSWVVVDPAFELPATGGSIDPNAAIEINLYDCQTPAAYCNDVWYVLAKTGISLHNTGGDKVHLWPNAAGTGYNVSKTKPS